MWQLFLLVAALTAVSFGGGNTLMAGLEQALVPAGRIGTSQFAFAVALGQSTPGPMAAFTTALGMVIAGTGGAVAATLGLMVVSLLAVLLITRIPSVWFQAPAVRNGLSGVAPFVAALALFLGFRMLFGGGQPGWVGTIVAGVVAFGRLRKLPAPLLIIGVVALRLIVG